MKKNKKEKKIKKNQKPNECWIESENGSYRPKVIISEILKDQADMRNSLDCANIINELNEASLNGEYVKTIQLKVNQAHYLKSLGLTIVESERFGYYEISWK